MLLAEAMGKMTLKDLDVRDKRAAASVCLVQGFF